MSTPVVENLAANVETTINAITTGAGFNQTLTAVRPKRFDFLNTTPEDGVCFVNQADPVKVESDVYNCIEWHQKFELIAIVIDSDAASTAIDIRLNQVRSDIEKKIMEDVTRGGYAIDTEIEAVEQFNFGVGYTGIIVVISCHYRVLDTDPYTQG